MASTLNVGDVVDVTISYKYNARFTKSPTIATVKVTYASVDDDLHFWAKPVGSTDNKRYNYADVVKIRVRAH